MSATTDPRFDLDRLGWDDRREAELRVHADPGLVPGRIAAELRGAYAALTAAGQVSARVPGRLHHEASGPGDLPIVGDWVVLDPAGQPATIQVVLERRTALARKAAGRGTVEQVLAANIDVVLVVSSLDGEPNQRRLERYLTAVWESGATPIVVLTKADLRPDADAVAADVAAATLVPAHPVSALTGAGVDAVLAHLGPAVTAALVGPSGAGKSTLVNHLLGREAQETQGVRDDGKGRHTTTSRELFLLPGGGIVVDTPGLRELGLWGSGEGTGEAFAEIEELAARCRFNDCNHEAEPGCAVRAAVEDGRLDPERLSSFKKLESELAHLARRQDARAATEQRRAYRRLARSFRKPKGPWQS